MGQFQFGIENEKNVEKFKVIVKEFVLLSDYKDKLNTYLLYPDFLQLCYTLYFTKTIQEENIYSVSDLEFLISIIPKTKKERGLYNTLCCCLNLAEHCGLEEYDKYDFSDVLAKCVKIEIAKFDKSIREHRQPMKYAEAIISNYSLENLICHKVIDNIGIKNRIIEKGVYDSLLINDPINYDYFLEEKIQCGLARNDYWSVKTLGINILKVHILFYLEGELKKFKTLDYEKEILQNQKIKLEITPSATEQPTNTKESETALIKDQGIIYKHIEHLKRINLNREKIMSDENFKQLFNDLCYLVENDAVPEIKKPLSTIGVTNQSIIYTLRLIHVELFGCKKIRQSFILFLETYFQQLSDRENMKLAFSKKPPKKYPF